MGGYLCEMAKVDSLVPWPESHDEDGRDSIEKLVAERIEQLLPKIAFISCCARQPAYCFLIGSCSSAATAWKLEGHKGRENLDDSDG